MMQSYKYYYKKGGFLNYKILLITKFALVL